MGKTNFNSVQFDGDSVTVGAETFKVYQYDESGYYLLCAGTTPPTDAGAGFAKGCKFIDTNASAGNIEYRNEGTTSSCNFDLVASGSVVAMGGDISGNSDNATVAAINGIDVSTLAATNAYIIKGDGTKFVSSTLDNAGIVAKSGAQTGIAGAKTFEGVITASAGVVGALTGNVTGNVSGNAGTVTNGLYTTSTDAIGANLLSKTAQAYGDDMDINLSNSSAGKVTNLTIDGQFNAEHLYSSDDAEIVDDLAVGGDLAVTGGASAATLTISTSLDIPDNSIGADKLPKVPTDYGNVTLVVDISNSNGANVSNFVTDGSVTAGSLSAGSGAVTCGSLATAGCVKANNLQAAAADLGGADVTVDLSNSNAGGFVTNVTTDGTITAGTLVATTAITVPDNSIPVDKLPAVPTDMGNATITVDFSNSNGANVTNIVTDGSVTAGSLSAGSGAVTCGSLATANIVKATNLTAVPTDLGAATITVDLSNSNGANVTNLVTDGSITGGSLSAGSGAVTCGSLATAGCVKASNLQAAAADLGAADVTVDLSNTNGAFVTNVTIDGAMTAGSFVGNVTGNISGYQTVTETADGTIENKALCYIDASGDLVQAVADATTVCGINVSGAQKTAAQSMSMGISGAITGIALQKVDGGALLKAAGLGKAIQFITSSLATATMQVVAAGGGFGNQPGAGGLKVQILSSELADNDLNYTIYGIDHTLQTVVSEVIQTHHTDATTPVASVNTYDYLLAITGDAHAGTITLETSATDDIITMATGTNSKGYTAVTTESRAFNSIPTIVSSAGVTSKIGIVGLNSSAVAQNDWDTLNESTTVNMNSVFSSVSYVLAGDLAADKAVTLKVGPADNSEKCIGRAGSAGQASANGDLIIKL